MQSITKFNFIIIITFISQQYEIGFYQVIFVNRLFTPKRKALERSDILTEAVVQRFSVEKMFLEISGKHLCQSLFLNKSF